MCVYVVCCADVFEYQLYTYSYLLSWWACLLYILSHPVRLHLFCPRTLINSQLFVFSQCCCSLCCDHILCLRRMTNQDGRSVCCSCRGVETTIWCEDNSSNNNVHRWCYVSSVYNIIQYIVYERTGTCRLWRSCCWCNDHYVNVNIGMSWCILLVYHILGVYP